MNPNESNPAEENVGDNFRHDNFLLYDELNGLTDIVKKIWPAVCKIETNAGSGTGWLTIVGSSEKFTVLTNKHVVAHCSTCTCYQADSIKLRFFYDARGAVGTVILVDTVRYIAVGGHDFAVLEFAQNKVEKDDRQKLAELRLCSQTAVELQLFSIVVDRLL